MNPTFFKALVRASLQVTVPVESVLNEEGDCVGLRLPDNSIVKFWITIERTAPTGESEDLNEAQAARIGVTLVDYLERKITPDNDVLAW